MRRNLLRFLIGTAVVTTPLIAVSFFFSQERGLVVHKDKFSFNYFPQLPKMPAPLRTGTFEFYIRYRGKRPAWWGDKQVRAELEQVQVFNRLNTQLRPADRFDERSYLKTVVRFEEDKDAYHSSIIFSLPANHQVKGGQVRAKVRLFDADNPSHTYAQAQVDEPIYFDVESGGSPDD